MSKTARLAMRLALVSMFLAIMAVPATAQETVGVSLNEWQVSPASTSVMEGDVVFPVRNDGVIAHNFVVIKTDLAPDALPVNDETYMVEEDQLNVVARSAELLGGESTQVSANLPPGNYVLICNNLPTHYQAGMYVGFQVTAAPEPTEPSPPVGPTAAPGEPTATPAAGADGSAAIPTQAIPQVGGAPVTGQGPQAGSSGWWTLAALAAGGAVLTGLGAAAHLQARQRSKEYRR